MKTPFEQLSEADQNYILNQLPDITTYKPEYVEVAGPWDNCSFSHLEEVNVTDIAYHTYLFRKTEYCNGRHTFYKWELVE